jgi:predicted nucleotide-binding protein
MPDLALTLTSLNGFLNTARVESQSEILKWFLRMIILGKDRDGADLCESGSVMVYRPDGKLHVFNDDNFLFDEGLLDKSKFKKMVFEKHEGMAGRAFTQQKVQYSTDVKANPSFVNEGEPIRCMLCAPIMLPSRPTRPFGVASFHNSPGAGEFSPETRVAMELAVNNLAFALDLAARMPSNSVFIVHGRDTAALQALKNILLERGIRPRILAEQPGRGKELLEELEELLSECCAGFVLLTPDDEGLLKGENPPGKPRARQNVIFEGGWLMGLFRRDDRVCFLKTDDSLEMPSDFGALKTDPFDPKNPDANVARIEKVLRSWGIRWENQP